MVCFETAFRQVTTDNQFKENNPVQEMCRGHQATHWGAPRRAWSGELQLRRYSCHSAWMFGCSLVLFFTLVFIILLIPFSCVVIFPSLADRGYEAPPPGKWGNLSASWVARNGPKHGLLHVDTNTKEVRRLSLDDPAVQEFRHHLKIFQIQRQN